MTNRETLNKVECPACGWHGKKFLDIQCGYGHSYKNVECPECKSQPRHILFYLYLKSKLDANRKL